MVRLSLWVHSTCPPGSSLFLEELCNTSDFTVLPNQFPIYQVTVLILIIVICDKLVKFLDFFNLLRYLRLIQTEQNLRGLGRLEKLLPVPL